jgi:zinc/manganese transport system substrate-binding protein
MSLPVRRALTLALAAAVAGGALLAGHGTPSAAASAPVRVVAAENEYASVVQAVGGPYVRVTAVMSNPSVDPHTYEASTAVAVAVAEAQLVVQNGVGYDGFMQKIEAAAPSRSRIVLTVGQALGYGRATKNPHLWYNPSTMPRVASLIAQDLGRLVPARKAYFAARVRAFDAALTPWHRALTTLRQAYLGAPVAVTEPVADDMLQAGGLVIKTPWAFQVAVMNGTDPAPQDVATEDGLLEHGKVRVLVYNRQAVSAVTESLLSIARAHHVPVVGAYETMPPGYTYPAWMAAETQAVYRALKYHTSTVTLK